jgi:hypothetical protein
VQTYQAWLSIDSTWVLVFESDTPDAWEVADRIVTGWEGRGRVIHGRAAVQGSVLVP